MVTDCAKATAIMPSDKVMMAEPMVSSSLRPRTSISRTATMVATTLVTEVISEMVKESDSAKPTDFHSVVE